MEMMMRRKRRKKQKGMLRTLTFTPCSLAASPNQPSKHGPELNP